MLINGEKNDHLIGHSIQMILDHYTLVIDRVVVEYNGSLLDLSTNHTLITKDDDVIEIIGLVGGG